MPIRENQIWRLKTPLGLENRSTLPTSGGNKQRFQVFYFVVTIIIQLLRWCYFFCSFDL